MGLTTWENSPDGKILKSDVIIAKNYLNEQEIKNLNNLDKKAKIDIIILDERMWTVSTHSEI